MEPSVATAYRLFKLYPSTEHFQHRDTDDLDLDVAIDYLTRLRAAIPAGASRDGATLRGWKGLSVWFRRELTEAELRAERADEIRTLLIAAEGRPLKPEERDRILLLAR